MRLAFKLFSACLLVEMMCLYHCFGHDAQAVSYATKTTIYNVDQVGPTGFSFFDLVEFLENKDSDENSEEDTEHNLSSTSIRCIGSESSIGLTEFDQNATHRLLNFKENKAPLFVLFHSWKYHIDNSIFVIPSTESLYLMAW